MFLMIWKIVLESLGLLRSAHLDDDQFGLGECIMLYFCDKVIQR